MAAPQPYKTERVPTAMSMKDKQPPYDDATIAEYAIGVLPHAERLTFQKTLETDPTLRERLRDWEEQLSGQADVIEPASAPEAIFTSAEERLFGAKKPTSGWVENLKNWRLPALASAVALLLVGLIFWNDARINEGSDTMYLADITNQSYEIQVVGIFDPETSEFHLRRLVGVAEPNRDFELWLIDGDAAPVSLGVMPSNAIKSVVKVRPELSDALLRGLLAISDEPQGGSPTGQPTGAVLATGKIIKV